jgi:flagellar motor switch protein FliM
MPYTLIDSILKDLQTDIQNVTDDAKRRRMQRLQAQLEGALKTYFETIRRETNMLVNKPSVERAKRLRV